MLARKWPDPNSPFLVGSAGELSLASINAATQDSHLSSISRGDVVALVGDFTPKAIALLFQLIDLGAVIVPLT